MGETEIVKIINIKTDQAVNTVKELRTYINDLKDDLVKLDKGSKEYEETLEEIAKAQTKLTEVQKDSKNAMNYQEGSYRALNQELVNLRNEYKNLSEAERNNAEVGGAMLSRIQELDTELKSIDATMGNYQRNVGHYQLALEALNKTYASERQELKALKVAMESLTPGTEEYTKAFNRAAEITHNLSEQQLMLRYSTTDLGDQISNIRGIATNMIAGFSAVNAAMGLFGEKNEDVAKAMLKVQQAMAIVQGLEGMDGLLKRTRGLSTAMKVWFDTSKQVTTQTIAQTTAVQGETVATEGATVAQKGLNAAMKANPIGVILTAVMALVTAWTIFGKKITELIKGNEKLNNILTKTKAVLATIGETLKQAVLVPLKEVVNYFTTFGNVLVDVFTGQWGKIGDDIKEGLGNAVDIVKEAGTNIGKAYNESIKEQNEKAERERSQKRAKELEEIIKDNDAKYDSDWKYTESGKTIYEEYLNAKIKSYKKDSEEYNEAVREKMSFDKEYNKYVKKQEEEATKKAKEEADKRKKAYEDAKKQQEQIESKYQSLIQKNYGNSVREIRKSFEEQLKAYIQYYESMAKTNKNNAILEQLEDAKKILKEFSDKNTLELQIKAGGYRTVEEMMESELGRLMKAYQATIDDAIKNSETETATKLNDAIVRLYEKSIVPNYTKENEKLKAKLEGELVDINLSLFKNGGEEKEIERTNLVFNNTVEQLENVKSHYQQIVDFVDNNKLTPSEEYENALLMVSAATAQMVQAEIDKRESLKEIRNKYFQQQLAEVETQTTELIRAKDKAEVESQSTDTWSLFGGADPAKEQQIMDEIYNIEKTGLERIAELWQQRKDDETLSYEEREQAKQSFAETMAQIDDLEVEHQAQTTEKKKELIQTWVDQMSTALNTIGQLFNTLANSYKDDIDAQKKANKISNQEAEKQYNQKVKPLMIAEATISTLQGMVSAFSGAMQLGPIAGPIVGGILAGLVGTMGAINIAKIASTNPYSDSSGGGSALANPPSADYDFQPEYTQNVTGAQDIDYLRNTMTEQPIKAYVVESDITSAQELANTRNGESTF